LSNAMDSGITDFRIGVLKVLDNDGDHRGDLLNVIKILSDLR
jgi:hypothetical protein